MCVLGGGRGAELCPQCSKTSSFCLRGGNWDAKPARASHSSFPFSSLLSFSQSGGGSSDTSWPPPPPWLPLFHPLTLSLMISCFLCSSLPRPPTGARAWQRRGHQREDSRCKQEDGDRKDGRPPSPPPSSPPHHLHPLFLTSAAQSGREKRKLFPLFHTATLLIQISASKTSKNGFLLHYTPLISELKKFNNKEKESPTTLC